ncbi:ATP-binding protein [Polyangium sp. 15x6]|uniref:AAA family ATPase n=1 Tax=Polyangium sp. 15x6 TaxID=3042687 RepID=UPI00249B7BE2|nr:ATP-binding protein [Polyangium sp. 15x6]MDI3281899.1 ATP-binding protein [Polyangium sp. 15x6]
MDLDPMFLQRALELRSNAIGYHLGRELEAWARPRAVLELLGNEIDLLSFARAGRCEATFREDIRNDAGVRWAQRGRIEHEHGTSWLRVMWEGHALEAIRIDYTHDRSNTFTHFIVAENMDTARAFATALADFCALPPNAALVFSNGCWSRDRSGFTAIQNARAEDLVFPPGFFECIRGDVRHFISSRETYAKYGIAYKRGLLFAGPPGNGKTACIRVLLRELGLPCLVVRSFQSRYGEVEQSVATVFSKAKRAAPCALVLEDLDVLVRGTALSALLEDLDGLSGDTGILTLATSNHPEELDPALVDRPSRFDRVYRFEPPATSERRRYFERWNERLEPELRLDAAVIADLVERTGDLSFAFLQELIVSAMVRWVAEPHRHPMPELLRSELDSLLAQRGAATASPPPPQRREP